MEEKKGKKKRTRKESEACFNFALISLSLLSLAFCEASP